MKRGHFIGMDTLCQSCEIAVVNHSGALGRRERCATCIPDWLKIIEQVPRPRSLVIEEGPLAGWLWRNLHEAVDQMVVSEPRRNRLIAKDGDKDDDLDAEKLAQLLRGGYVKAVHQVQTLSVRCSNNTSPCTTIGCVSGSVKPCASAACSGSTAS